MKPTIKVNPPRNGLTLIEVYVDGKRVDSHYAKDRRQEWALILDFARRYGARVG